MTRILADECIPMPVVSLLRKQGFDVLSILESHASEPDSFVIEKAVSEQRLILTADVELASQP